jgi:hypothetical protein
MRCDQTAYPLAHSARVQPTTASICGLTHTEVPSRRSM